MCMEVARLILDFTKVLIWPAVVLTLALVFRHPLRAILQRLRKAGLPGGVSIDFREEIEEARELSEKVEKEPAPPNRSVGAAIPLTGANARMIDLGLRPTASGLDFNYYREIAQKDPNLALAGLRIEIEVLAHNLAHGFQLESSRSEPLPRLLSRLHREGAITTDQHELTRRVLRLCNEAVHGRSITRVEAEEVIDLAGVIAEQFLAWLSWGFNDNWKPRQSDS